MDKQDTIKALEDHLSNLQIEMDFEERGTDKYTELVTDINTVLDEINRLSSDDTDGDVCMSCQG